MVKLMGHLGIALLLTVPVWFRWTSRRNLVFVGLVLSAVMLPDVDLLLNDFLPIAHHGITHTVVFVAIVAVVTGAIVEYALLSRLGSDWIRRRGLPASDRRLFVFVTGALLVGGMSHLFMDILSAPDVADPLEPFWPLVDRPFSLDVIYYSSIWWNVGLLTVGILAHLIVASIKTDIEWPSGLPQEQ